MRKGEEHVVGKGEQKSPFILSGITGSTHKRNTRQHQKKEGEAMVKGADGKSSNMILTKKGT